MTKKGHFKQEQTAQKIVRFESTSIKCKRPNKNQAVKPQQQTLAATGLIPCGKLAMARNVEDCKVELMFRGMKEEDVPVSITERKNELRKLELKRLPDAGALDAAKAKDQHPSV